MIAVYHVRSQFVLKGVLNFRPDTLTGFRVHELNSPSLIFKIFKHLNIILLIQSVELFLRYFGIILKVYSLFR